MSETMANTVGNFNSCCKHWVFFLHAYIVGDTMDTLSPGLETHIAMMGMAESAFLKAIFILLLAIFAWMQKEYRHY